MMRSLAITHAQVVLESEVLGDGTVTMIDGLVREVGPSENIYTKGFKVLDAAGAYLIPGIIDTHNDGLEMEINPRPRVNFPPSFAMANFEKRAVASGVTSVFHAVYFANLDSKERSIAWAKEMADTVVQNGAGIIDHYVLHRLDVWSSEGLDPLFQSMRRNRVQAMSLNDHTPGQGQFRNLDEYRKTLEASRDSGLPYFDPDQDVDGLMAHRANDLVTVPGVLQRVCDEFLAEPFVLMSHDDDTVDKVDRMAELGVRMAEFPVTLAAAQRARERGMWITVGAPNIVRGGSTSKNLDAAQLVGEGLADIVCSDYHAPCLLAALLKLVKRGTCDLPQAIRMVSANPADAFGLHTVGRIAPGLSADLCLFSIMDEIPHICAVIKNGKVIHYTGRSPLNAASAGIEELLMRSIC